MRATTLSACVALLAAAVAVSCAAAPTRESTGEVVDDSAITAKVKAALVGNPTTKAREIKVTTSHGVVELSGVVNSNEEKDTAAQVASGVQGVKAVDNELQLKPAQ